VGALHPNPRKFKQLRTYTVDEIARLAPAHKNTVRRWISKAGLTPIDDKRPTYILGRIIIEFLEERRRKAKKTCPPGFMFCLPCRGLREPADRRAELVQLTQTSANLRGRCPYCGRLMHRRVSLAKLASVRGNLDITMPEAKTRLRETTAASLNSDSSKDEGTNADA
jgi:hypothetical protein